MNTYCMGAGQWIPVKWKRFTQACPNLPVDSMITRLALLFALLFSGGERARLRLCNGPRTVQYSSMLAAGSRSVSALLEMRDGGADTDGTEGQDERHQGGLELSYTLESKASLTL